MGSPVSPIVVNLYMEKFKLKAFESYQGNKLRTWLRYVDDTFVTLKKRGHVAFFDYINKVDQHISFTQEACKDM